MAGKARIAAAATKTAQAKLKSETGIMTMYPALGEKLIPGFNEHHGVPYVRCRRPLTTRTTLSPVAQHVTDCVTHHVTTRAPQDPMHVLASQGTLSSEGYTCCNRLIKNGHMTWSTFAEVAVFYLRTLLANSFAYSTCVLLAYYLRKLALLTGLPTHPERLRPCAAWLALCRNDPHALPQSKVLDCLLD